MSLLSIEIVSQDANKIWSDGQTNKKQRSDVYMSLFIQNQQQRTKRMEEKETDPLGLYGI